MDLVFADCKILDRYIVFVTTFREESTSEARYFSLMDIIDNFEKIVFSNLAFIPANNARHAQELSASILALGVERATIEDFGGNNGK